MVYNIDYNKCIELITLAFLDELIVFGLQSKMGISCEQFRKFCDGQELEEVNMLYVHKV